MKAIKYIITASVLVLAASCDINRMPQTTLTESTFWKSESDFAAASAKLLEFIPKLDRDTRADEVHTTVANAISNGSRNVPATASDWSDPYKGIYYANNIIYHAEQSGLPESAIGKYVAEARFHRAYQYFLLDKKYGGVPLLLKPTLSTTDETVTQDRATRQEVVDQILADLEYAAANLPDIDKAVWGHPSRSAALGMIVRVCLYHGTYDKYHAGTPRVTGTDYKVWLKKSIDAAETLIAEGKHGLFPTYDNNLFMFPGEGRANKENLFVRVYGPYGTTNSTFYNGGRTASFDTNIGLTRNIADMFIYTDGLPREKTKLKVKENSYNDMFVNRDPRLAAILFKVHQAGEDPFGRGEHEAFVAMRSTYSLAIKKYHERLVLAGENNHCTVDDMNLRYAEVLVSYAEALYEYNGTISDGQLDLTVNALRKRAGNPGMLTNALVSANGLSMIEEIRRERTMEFVHEGLRYDDLIRWKTAEKALTVSLYGAKYIDSENSVTRVGIASRLTDANGDIVDTHGTKMHVCDEADVYVMDFATDRRFDPDKDYLYPIPIEEITLSGHTVENFQNPGWI